MGYISDSHYWLVIYIIVGLSALLVSTNRAIPEPQYVERAQTAPRLNRNINHITLIINNTSTGTLWFDTVKFPLFLFSQEASFYNNMSILCR